MIQQCCDHQTCVDQPLAPDILYLQPRLSLGSNHPSKESITTCMGAWATEPCYPLPSIWLCLFRGSWTLQLTLMWPSCPDLKHLTGGFIVRSLLAPNDCSWPAKPYCVMVFCCRLRAAIICSSMGLTALTSALASVATIPALLWDSPGLLPARIWLACCVLDVPWTPHQQLEHSPRFQEMTHLGINLWQVAVLMCSDCSPVQNLYLSMSSAELGVTLPCSFNSTTMSWRPFPPLSDWLSRLMFLHVKLLEQTGIENDGTIGTLKALQYVLHWSTFSKME